MKLEDIFYDKEKCDHLRNMLVDSTIDQDFAFQIINVSLDLDRDVPIAMKLTDSGYDRTTIIKIIIVLNS